MKRTVASRTGPLICASTTRPMRKSRAIVIDAGASTLPLRVMMLVCPEVTARTSALLTPFAVSIEPMLATHVSATDHVISAGRTAPV
ncbi:MAG: hypothetical protein ACREON_10090 [Gemmatimonadaceae bacterium]